MAEEMGSESICVNTYTEEEARDGFKQVEEGGKVNRMAWSYILLVVDGDGRPMQPVHLLARRLKRRLERRARAAHLAVEFDCPDVGIAVDRFVPSRGREIDYFVVSVEAWMVKSGYKKLVGDKGCTIVGHSFGAYIAAWYAASEYDKGFVNGLVLLSPGGLPRQPQLSKEEIMKNEDKKDAIDDTKEILWGNNFSPLLLVRASGKFLASQIIR